jgi:hypothetical protein
MKVITYLNFENTIASDNCFPFIINDPADGDGE